MAADAGGQITHFVAGMGTSGTLMGTGRRLRELQEDIQVVAVQPASPFHGLEGLKHMDSAILPGIYDPNFVDENMWIQTEKSAGNVTPFGARRRVFGGCQRGGGGGCLFGIGGAACRARRIRLYRDDFAG